uniref:Phorbol-ester/DAG-type domain-containing protein n=1 Tax=Gossypium raimondii TaxID=29730 RepID=A0A0D2V7T6_GOSRA|nr:hypothetical protein B456_013G012100 [Gossypium raimondii]
MKIQHVIHHHPLLFIQEESTLSSCRGCRSYLSGPTYGCKPCRFFIHKSCLDEHKAEVQCFFHPCPLTISTESFFDSNQKDEVICSICEGLCSSSSSTYGCMQMRVFFCMKSIPLQFINHRIHPCTLKFFSSKRKYLFIIF